MSYSHHNHLLDAERQVSANFNQVCDALNHALSVEESRFSAPLLTARQELRNAQKERRLALELLEVLQSDLRSVSHAQNELSQDQTRQHETLARLVQKLQRDIDTCQEQVSHWDSQLQRALNNETEAQRGTTMEPLLEIKESFKYWSQLVHYDQNQMLSRLNVECRIAANRAMASDAQASAAISNRNKKHARLERRQLEISSASLLQCHLSGLKTVTDFPGLAEIQQGANESSHDNGELLQLASELESAETELARQQTRFQHLAQLEASMSRLDQSLRLALTLAYYRD